MFVGLNNGIIKVFDFKRGLSSDYIIPCQTK